MSLLLSLFSGLNELSLPIMSLVEVGEFLECLGDSLMVSMWLLLPALGLPKDVVEPAGEILTLGTGDVFPFGGSELGEDTGLEITGKATLG